MMVGRVCIVDMRYTNFFLVLDVSLQYETKVMLLVYKKALEPCLRFLVSISKGISLLDLTVPTWVKPQLIRRSVARATDVNQLSVVTFLLVWW